MVVAMRRASPGIYVASFGVAPSAVVAAALSSSFQRQRASSSFQQSQAHLKSGRAAGALPRAVGYSRAEGPGRARCLGAALEQYNADTAQIEH